MARSRHGVSIAARTVTTTCPWKPHRRLRNQTMCSWKSRQRPRNKAAPAVQLTPTPMRGRKGLLASHTRALLQAPGSTTVQMTTVAALGPAPEAPPRTAESQFLTLISPWQSSTSASSIPQMLGASLVRPDHSPFDLQIDCSPHLHWLQPRPPPQEALFESSW